MFLVAAFAQEVLAEFGAPLESIGREDLSTVLQLVAVVAVKDHYQNAMRIYCVGHRNKIA